MEPSASDLIGHVAHRTLADGPVHAGLTGPDLDGLLGRELIAQLMPGRLADIHRPWIEEDVPCKAPAAPLAAPAIAPSVPPASRPREREPIREDWHWGQIDINTPWGTGLRESDGNGGGGQTGPTSRRTKAPVLAHAGPVEEMLEGEMKACPLDSARGRRQDGTKPGKPVRRAGLCHGNWGDGDQRITLKCQAVLCLLMRVICD
jgi:hypothetical protein